MDKIDNLEEFMKKYDNLDTRKSRTFSSEMSALSCSSMSEFSSRA